MKKTCLLSISLLTLAVSTALTQTSTPTPTWFKVVPSESPSLKVTLPAGGSIEWCDAATGKVCTLATYFPPQTTITAYCPSVPSCNAYDASSNLSGVSKSILVMETAAAQTMTLTDSSVSPAKVTSVAIPALPAPSYPPITFAPGKTYTFAVSNIPPASSSSPLQAALQITDGANVVTAVCTYKTTVLIAATSTSPAGEQASFTCVPVPPK